MQLKCVLVASALVLSLGQAAALGQTQSIRRQVWEGGTLISEKDYSSGSAISVKLTRGTTRVNLFSVGNGALASIGTLTFFGAAPSSLDLVIGSGALVANPATDLPDAAANWAGGTLPANTRLSGAISGNLTGAINPLSIVRLEVNGQLSDSIDASAASGMAIDRLVIGSSTADGTVTAGSASSGGNIGVVESTSSVGAISGAISAPRGSIGSVLAAGDLFGSVLAGGDIDNVLVAGRIASPGLLEIKSATGAIGVINVAEDIWADGEGGVQIDAPDGIDQITCEAMTLAYVGPQTFDPGAGIPVGDIAIAGSAFACSMHFTTFNRIDIGGSLSSFVVPAGGGLSLEAVGRIVVSEVAANNLLRIGGRLGPFSYIKTENATPSLAGQIIINANGGTIPDLGSSGNVLVRTGSITAITIPGQASFFDHYSAVRSQLGGGAVGVVPYRLHAADGSPVSDSDPYCGGFTLKKWPASHGGGKRETIVLQFYGPVFDAADTYHRPDDPQTVPVVVSVQSIAFCVPSPCWDEEPNWTNRTDLFDVYVPGNGSREVWIARKLHGSPAAPVGLGNHRYQITPAVDVAHGEVLLRCDRTNLDPASAPEVYNFVYQMDPYCNER